MKRLKLLITLILFAIAANAQEREGYWNGKISYRGSVQEISLDIKQQNSKYAASISIPAMGMLDVALDDFSLEKDDIAFTLPLGRGKIRARYKGDKITGETSDDEYDEFRVLLSLQRSVKKPPPYKKENVIFYNKDIKLAGTLIVPNSGKTHSAIVVLHGSNPRTRDFFVYSYLGNVFARRGVAVLLYDGRGAGESAGDFPTADFRDLAEDALAGVKFLKTRSDIKPDQIGLWGISQGGWVAPEAVSLSEEVAFLIIVSGAAVGPGEQMNFSTANLLRENGFSDEAINRAIALRNKVNSFYQGKISREEAQKAIDASRGEEWFSLAGIPGNGNLPKDFSRSKWYREVNYNPLPALEKIKIPVLVL
jgi:uncharacterized protein